MSDYLFILENHLDPGQNRVVAEAQTAASSLDVSLWLTGGAMRDVLLGARVSDLDFTVERDALKIGKALASSLGGTISEEDPLKRFVELDLPGGIRASVSNSRTEKYSKPGGKPQIQPAGIHEDLARRDFTINAIALALNRGSRGLLVDPTNGQADVISRELRATNPYIFFDNPARIFRLIRLRHTLGFEPVPRLVSQMENALLEGYQTHAPSGSLPREIRRLASGPNATAATEAFDKAGLLKGLSPALTGAKVNTAGLTRFERLLETVLPAATATSGAAFLHVLTEKLSVRDRSEVHKALDLPRAAAEELRHLPALTQKLEALLASAKLTRPSHVYEALSAAAPDVILSVLYSSSHRVVPDRIRAYYQKYLPLAEEITPEMVEATGAKPGTPKFQKVFREMIAAHLNARPKKVVAESEPEPPPAPVGRPRKA